MKSKRVTKLLACALSVAMCASPVWASSADYADKNQKGSVGGDITTEVGPYSPVVSVNVPTKARVEINPLFDKTNASVNGWGIASKSLLITNKSYDTDKNMGIPLVVTADAQITGKKPGVKTYYETGNRSGFTPSANSSAKEAWMSVSVGSLGSATTSTNADYKSGVTKTDVITTAGSQVQLQVTAPVDATASSRTYGAFAVVGDANVNAKWQDDDITIALSYDIQAANSGVKEKPTLANSGLSISSVTSQNAISINSFPVKGLDGAFVESITIHDATENGEEWVLDANDESQVKWDLNTAGTHYTLSIPASDDIDWYATEIINGKAYDMIIKLDDGRYIKAPLQ